ncbi:MAG TPA: ABC transporter substrate-binding protein [Ruminiclostridium sp.]
MKLSKRKTLTKALSVLLASSLLITVAGCNQPKSTSASASGKKYAEEITYDDYEATQNFQGLQTGWFAKIIKDKFNIKLNVIAPNMSGQATFQTRSAAGNLGDLVSVQKVDLSNVVKAGLLMDMSPLMKDHGSNLSKYPVAINSIKSYLKTDKMYAIPNGLSTLSPTEPNVFANGATVQTQDGSAPYLRWDLYQAIGSPKMNTMEDILPVLKKMQDLCPKSNSGKKTYGFSFFKDWDSQAMKNVWSSFPAMYGYNMVTGTSTILTNGDSSKLDVQRLDDENGLYYKTLKLYYQANKMGLVDPDSPSQTWNTLTVKTKDGQVLFSQWAWAAMSQYNTTDLGNATAPKGFEFVPIADQKYWDGGNNPNGSGGITAIGIKAKDPARLMDFINWLADPETELMIANGPKGSTWDVKDGQPVLTDFGLKVHQDGKTQMPESLGGGPFEAGAAMSAMISQNSINSILNTPSTSSLWPSVLDNSATKLDKSWQLAMDAKNMIDYTKKHNMLVVSAGNDYIPPLDTMDIKSERAICQKFITNTSWQMIFASNDAQFNSLWSKMKSQLKGNGWEDIVATDMKISKDYNAACQQVINTVK